MTALATFEQAMDIVFGEEAGFSSNPRDPGNWTGGRIGAGQLRGTNYGISAKSYPDIDIRGLTRVAAHGIYFRDYWQKFNCDKLPPALALLVFDCGVNGGHPTAWLQAAVGAQPDGVFGPHTMAAVQAHYGTGADVCARFMQARWLYLTSLQNWPDSKGGWSARLCALPYHAMSMK